MNNYQKHFEMMRKNKSQPQPGRKFRRTSLNYKSNKVNKGNRFLHTMGFVSLFGFGLALYGFLYPDNVLSIVNNGHIGFFSQSLASEKAVEPVKSAEAAATTEANPAADPQMKDGEAEPKKASAVKEKANHIEYLLTREKELDEREKKIQELEAKLQQDQLELEKKIQVLENTRREIASRLETRVAQDEESIGKLVGVYSNMKPQTAAQVISKLDEELAIGVLKRMKKQDAGSILNYMDPQKAKVLSEKYSGY